MTRSIVLGLLLLLLASPGSAVLAAEVTEAEFQALEAKYDALEKRLSKLEAEQAKSQAGEQNQSKALALLRQARGAAAAGRGEEARKLLAEIDSKYPQTKAARHAKQFSREVNVLGIDAGELDVEKWYLGNAEMNDGDITILVFWESWCPHCKREVPKLESLYQKYSSRGMNLIGLTKVTKSSTDEKVEAFIAEHSISYPTAKENAGAMSRKFAVSGVPAAAVVQNGKVIWRGHPSGLVDARIEGWLAEPQG